MRIIIFGAPGVGKGTQAKIIASKLNIVHISTGDILRTAIKNETELGLKAKSIVESGGLVPDDIVAGMLKDALKEDRCKKGYILDGFPRTLAQAEMLSEIFKELGTETNHLIKLEAKDEIIVDRISNRLVCSVCGNILAKKLVTNNFVCPNCNARDSYYKRKDDDEEVIKNRLKVYHEQTVPVFNYYSYKAHIIEIDGTKSIEEISMDILDKLM
ncbi:MAG: adenylate kinase [Ignavibacteria bacterium]|nr:MAG: adenylate kinase [Ignavibacteria bacterium]KAF0159725.1 MAG: adenylate kinase [Ignavibacteria bacterium]